MKSLVRILKSLVAVLAAIVIFPLLAYLLLWVLLFMLLSGVWPFPPLETFYQQVSLYNGGDFIVEGIEDRGFGSDGFVMEARYRPPDGETLEKVGSWIGHENRSEPYLTDKLVVVIVPGHSTFYVRTEQGKWRFFNMSFPGRSTSLSLSFYSTMTTFSEDYLKSLKADLEPGTSPNSYVESFDPESMEVTVHYWTPPGNRKDLRFRLSNDGTHLNPVEQMQNQHE